jgi:hypothetical protein
VYCTKLIAKHEMMTYWCKYTATVLWIINV